MDIFRMTGGVRLTGSAWVGSAKNAVLPILAASILAGAPVSIDGFPYLSDTLNMLNILKVLGCRCTQANKRAVIDPGPAYGYEMPQELSKLLRSSIFMMGPILGRFKRAVLTYPGGCEIGLRPIDLHLKGLEALGVKIREAHGMIYCDAGHMQGTEVHLDFPSVGATENIMTAAATAKGVTMIHNAAREPEIINLQRFMNMLGADISGAGSGRIVIKGVDSLSGGCFRPMPDRIVAGTLLTAAAITGGEITVQNVCPVDMGAMLDKLRQMGCEMEIGDDQIGICAPRRLRSTVISTQPFPGFPTDMQAQFTALCCVAEGASVIEENVFENRFTHTSQLRRMGADIRVSGRTCVVRGGALTGARVTARDLRGGAALVLAGLAAEGVTEVEDVCLIDRGYEHLETQLSNLGACIERI